MNAKRVVAAAVLCLAMCAPAAAAPPSPWAAFKNPLNWATALEILRAVNGLNAPTIGPARRQPAIALPAGELVLVEEEFSVTVPVEQVGWVVGSGSMLGEATQVWKLSGRVDLSKVQCVVAERDPTRLEVRLPALDLRLTRDSSQEGDVTITYSNWLTSWMWSEHDASALRRGLDEAGREAAERMLVEKREHYRKVALTSAQDTLPPLAWQINQHIETVIVSGAR